MAIALSHRKVEPHVRTNIILSYPLSVGIQNAKAKLRVCVPLHRRKPIPLHCLLKVLRYAPPLLIHNAKINLCICIPLRRS